MTVVLIILLVLLLCGGGYGYNQGWYGTGAPPAGYNPIGIVVLILLVVVVVWLISGYRF